MLPIVGGVVVVVVAAIGGVIALTRCTHGVVSPYIVGFRIFVYF